MVFTSAVLFVATMEVGFNGVWIGGFRRIEKLRQWNEKLSDKIKKCWMKPSVSEELSVTKKSDCRNESFETLGVF